MQSHINQAVVYLPEKKVDPETYQLVSKMSESDVFKHVRVMPDCHSSSHCCVGMTCQINDKVIPQIVGGDIGCGISCYNLQKVIKEKQYQKYDNLVIISFKTSGVESLPVNPVPPEEIITCVLFFLRILNISSLIRVGSSLTNNLLTKECPDSFILSSRILPDLSEETVLVSEMINIEIFKLLNG